jgi:hypothetical protein
MCQLDWKDVICRLSTFNLDFYSQLSTYTLDSRLLDTLLFLSSEIIFKVY